MRARAHMIRYSVPLVGLLVLTMLGAGCVDADPSLRMTISSVGEFTTSEEATCGGVCEYSIDSDQLPNVEGFLDLARLEQYGQFPQRVPGSYALNVSVTNRLESNAEADGSGLRIDSNGVVIKEFRIAWKTVDGATIYEPGDEATEGVRPVNIEVSSGGQTEFVIVNLLSGLIYPNGENNEAAFLRGGLADALPNANLSQAPRLVFVEIQAIGETIDGSKRVESEVLSYPVSVCDGCQVFDTVLSYCCADTANLDTPTCPVFGANALCVATE